MGLKRRVPGWNAKDAGLGLIYGAFFGFIVLHERELYTQYGQVKAGFWGMKEGRMRPKRGEDELKSCESRLFRVDLELRMTWSARYATGGVTWWCFASAGWCARRLRRQAWRHFCAKTGVKGGSRTVLQVCLSWKKKTEWI